MERELNVQLEEMEYAHGQKEREMEQILERKEREMEQILERKEREIKKYKQELFSNQERLTHLEELLEAERLRRTELEEKLSAMSLLANLNSKHMLGTNISMTTSNHPPGRSRLVVSQRYQKTISSADMAGELFEVKLAALLFLRGINHTLHFHLASNLQAADKFDDLVFRYMADVTSGWKTIFIQLKHKQDTSFKVKRGQLLSMSPKSVFGLMKYCHSYLKVKENHQTDVDLKFLGSFDDFEFVLYTNASIPTLNMSDCVDSLISTGERGKAYSLTAKYDSDIFKALREIILLKELLTEIQNSKIEDRDIPSLKSKLDQFKISDPQMNAELHCKLNEIRKDTHFDKIEKDLQDFDIVDDFDSYEEFFSKFRLFCSQSDQKELGDIIESEIQIALAISHKSEVNRISTLVLKSVESWWGQNENIEFLTEHSTFWTDIVFSRFNQFSQETEAKLATFNLTFEQSLLTSLQQVLPTTGFLNVISNGMSTDLNCLKLQQALPRSDDTRSIYISLSSLLDSRKEVLHLWQNRLCRTLVIDYDCNLDAGETLCTELMQIVNTTLHIRVILVTCNGQSLSDFFKTDRLNYDEVRDECRWSDLTQDTQNGLLRRTIRFQGSQIPLSLLINQDERLSKQLQGDTLLSLLSDELELGLDLQPPMEYYIPRILVRFGVTKAVDSVSDVAERLVLVSAEPGMGKSTLLTHLAFSVKQSDPSCWVIRINLCECSQYLKRMQTANVRQITPIEILTEFALNTFSRLEEALLEHCLNTSGNVVLFLDGVDEIAPYYLTEISSIIQILIGSRIRSIWITFRPAVSETLEKLTRIVPYNIQPFTKDDQNKFLSKFWQIRVVGISEEQLTIFTERVLELAADAFRGENLVISIPQQTRMLGEYFEDQLKYFEESGKYKLLDKLNLLNLYQHFVQSKLEVNMRDKKKEDPTNTFILDDNETLTKLFFQNHQFASLNLLFSSKDLTDLGISHSQIGDFTQRIIDGREKSGIIDKIVDSKPHFIHRTFAEYFAATWLSENLHNCRIFIQSKLFLPEFEVIREIFDRLLATDYALHSAVISRDVESVQNLLISGTGVDEPDKGGRTALHLVSVYGHTHSAYKQITQILLDNEASMNIRDEVLHFRPLQYADETGSWTVAGLLLQKGGDPSDFKRAESCMEEKVFTHLLDFITNKVDDYSELLHSASLYGELRVVKYLLKEIGADANFPQEGQVTPLHRAAEGGHVDVLRYLVGKEARLTSTDCDQRTPLHYAAQHGHLEAIKYLVEQGLDVNASDKDGWAPVLLVTQLGHQEAMEYLGSKKASIQARDIKSFTSHQLGIVLLWSVYRNNVRFAQSLLNQKAPVNHTDDKGTSSLHWAAINNNFEMVKMLIKKCAEVNLKDIMGLTPLNRMFCASGNGNHQTGLKFENEKFKIVKHFIEEGACFGAVGGCKSTAEYAQMQGYSPQSKMAEYLTIKYVDLNVHVLNALESGNLLQVKKCVEQGADKFVGSFLPVAVISGSFELVEYILDILPESVNSRDHGGSSVLHSAVTTFSSRTTASESDRLKIVSHLIERGADVEAINLELLTPLHVAVGNGYLEGIKLLVRAGADMNTRGNMGCSSLSAACHFGFLEIAKYLISAGADINGVDESGCNALHAAVSRKSFDPDMYKFLLQSGIHLDAKAKDQTTPFMMSVCQGNIEMVTFLAEQGADINTTNAQGNMPIHAATECDHTSLVTFLLERGCNVDAVTSASVTSLMIASQLGNLNMVRHLVSAGANVNAVQSVSGGTSLHLAAYRGHIEVVKFLISCGAEVNKQDKNGNSPIMFASTQDGVNLDKSDTIQCLIDAGANVELSNKDGMFPIIVSAGHGDLNAVKTYIKAGCDVNIRHVVNNTTPLMAAAEGGHVDVLRVLTRAGADRTATSSSGHNVYHCAASSLPAMKFLTSSEHFVVDQVNHNQETLLMFACMKSSLEVVQFLVKKGAGIFKLSSHNNTCLHFAALGGKIETVRFLITRGLSVNATNSSNNTALDFASSSGHTLVVDYLNSR